ncbi:MAG: class I SAM-dependent methyltransferase [Gammaproteobacteria bacterium]|nr:class I SAM-dependent methyltransferase [Gammaproteobacteria bacterium]
MNPDIVRWNRKYLAASAPDYTEVDELLGTHAALLTGGGRALDIACGAGANAIFAASRGYAVLGVDGSIEGLRIARRRARAQGLTLQLVNADLDRFGPPPRRFDLIMVFRYLNRALFGPIEQALRPEGFLFFKTFNRNLLQRKPGFNQDYLLSPGELVTRFRALECIDTNDTQENDATQSWWVGRKPATRAQEPPGI